MTWMMWSTGAAWGSALQPGSSSLYGGSLGGGEGREHRFCLANFKSSITRGVGFMWVATVQLTGCCPSCMPTPMTRMCIYAFTISHACKHTNTHPAASMTSMLLCTCPAPPPPSQGLF